MSLLLLLAAEEKVCPWLHTAAASAQPAEPLPPVGPDGRPKLPPPPPLVMGNVLPDAMPSRWVGSACDAATRPLTAAVWSAIACGQPDPSFRGDSSDGFEALAALWQHPGPPRLIEIAPQADALLRVAFNPAVATAITELGPPRA